MDGRVKRPDLDNRKIAEDWIGGMSRLDLSVKYGCSPQTINTRLLKARQEHPDLDWGNRSASPRRPSLRSYATMNDGKRGDSMVRQGSVIRGSALRKR